MYKNIAGKIKGLAKGTFVINSIFYIMFAILLISEEFSFGGDFSFFFGWILLFLGPFIAWMSSLVIYGFGELIENVIHIRKQTTHLAVANSEKAKNTNVETTNGEGTIKRPPPARKKGDWICSDCGKINASYVGTCSCGASKPR